MPSKKEPTCSIAQGGEAGGFCGEVATMALVPQVVDAVAPVPVLAAGGIADGRGLAAALVLGAAGVNIGTRFLATVEARVPERYKARLVAAASQEAARIDPAPFPPVGPGGYVTAPRTLPTGLHPERPAGRGRRRAGGGGAGRTRGRAGAVRRADRRAHRVRRGRARGHRRDGEPARQRRWPRFPLRRRGGSTTRMKLLVLATDPVGADDVRSALPDADLEDSEVLVVSPAVNESAVAFWVSDADEAIAEAQSAAEQTAAALRERGTRARATTGESEPLVALQDALATYPADRVARLRARRGRGRATARTTCSARHSGASACPSPRSPADRQAQGLLRVVARRASAAARRALAGVHQHRPAQRFDPRRLLGQERQHGDQLGCRLDRERRAPGRCASRARRRDRSS